MTDGQKLAIEQLRQIETSSPDVLRLLKVFDPGQPASDFVVVELSIYCGDIRRVANGLAIRKRERFQLSIHSDFPYRPPAVRTVHSRFAGYPHVQWKNHLCLYVAPSSEWNPSDGIFGLLDRLHFWFSRAAIGELDATGQAVHPPVAYISDANATMIVPKVNTPVVNQEPWCGFVRLRRFGHHVELHDWTSINAFDPSLSPAGCAILLNKELPFEFPATVKDLLSLLAAEGVSRDWLQIVLIGGALLTPKDEPLYFVLGTPMRGIKGATERQQHLTVWEIAPIVADALRIALHQGSSVQELKDIGQRAAEIIWEWAAAAKISWCDVREDRDEVVESRDKNAVASWFSGKTISLWGCGAIGSHLAIMLTRLGASKLILHDRSRVTPGIICRQLYTLDDIGRHKAEALADHVRLIRPDIDVVTVTEDILSSPLNGADWTEGAHIVIDSTGSESVIAKLEFVRRRQSGNDAAVASMAVGHDALSCLLVVVGPSFSGGIKDALRKSKIDMSGKDHMRSLSNEFWPWPNPRTEVFQPEPGCSDATFQGSIADVSLLTSQMLNQTAIDLQECDLASANAHALMQPVTHQEGFAATVRYDGTWTEDHIFTDPHTGYEMRISQAAWSEIVASIKKSNRDNGPRVETGGILFGEWDDAARICWVSEVSGPPLDSHLANDRFICGTDDLAVMNEEKRERSRGSIQYVGSWHTHPECDPVPSGVDLQGMLQIVLAEQPPTPKALLMIVGFPLTNTTVGTYVFARKEFDQILTDGYYERPFAVRSVSSSIQTKSIGLSLSGGGSRAIAFHLGCLRALHDRGILDRLQVISCVSGGSIIGAMYAYGHGDFQEFDKRVTDLLRRGLQNDILKRSLISIRLPQIIGSLLISGGSAAVVDVAKWTLSRMRGVFGVSRCHREDGHKSLSAPIRRWVSTTTSFDDVLRRDLFGDIYLDDERRGGVNVVFNAAELRTGSAFRFGNKESGCWRFGRVMNQRVPVSMAVSASAAYPLIFPPHDVTWQFTKGKNSATKQRVLLTDGGLYENLGVSCLEPGRSEEFSFNVFKPEYVVACHAGQGLFAGKEYLSWWMPRVRRAFESVFRKTQDATIERLHKYARDGSLKGFVLSYLGQQDDKLPFRPGDLVPREEVVGYPTDLSPMSEEMINKIAARGESLTRLLIERYCPEL